MRKGIIALVIAVALVGIVGATTYFPGNVQIDGTLTAAVLAAASTISNQLAADLTINDGSDITAATGAEIFNYGASTSAFTTSQGTNTLKGNTVVDGSKTFTSGTGAVNLLGPTTIARLDAITAGSGSAAYDLSASTGAFLTPSGTNTHSGNVVNSKTVTYSVNATTSLDTVLTSSSTKTVYAIDASGADATITLPDAATVTGRIYYIAIKTDPGIYFARIKATAGKLGGASGIAAATGLKDTDVSGGITLLSDGANYLIVGQYFPVGGAGWVSG